MAVSTVPAWRRIFKYNDLIIGALVVAIIFIIVIPIRPALLDVLLTISITISMVILLTTMFITRPLQFSVFPSLLLVVTLYRLSLNIASTRLILTEAAAGQIISAFGDFVVGGNYVVGIIIFIIITVVQFVVITNGAGRVAEVAARFTLDAMPGKQMSIDADLNAGIITDNEARERRKNLQREADFFGAMDGASKFVKGDAIAGIVITFINIIGGFFIGILQMDMTLLDAIQKYTVLTVGDGLVSQVPALLVSVGTGILVTRAGSDEDFGADISKQLTRFPKGIALVSVMLFLLAVVPGIPTLPFLTLSVLMGFMAYILDREKKQTTIREEQAMAQKMKTKDRQPENVLGNLRLDTLEIEIGYNLVHLTDEERGGDLLDRLAAVRRQCAAELGVYVRPIRIRDNLELERNSYVFKIRGVNIAGGEIMPERYLAMNPMDNSVKVEGIATVEPTFGLPAWWVTRDTKEELEAKGFTVVDASTVLITHLTEFIKAHAYELLGRQETKELVETVKETSPAVVEELVPDLMTYGQIEKVLQNLLREQVPIKDMTTILEVLADNAPLTTDIDYLTEAVRQALYRTISSLYSENGVLKVITVDTGVEDMIGASLQKTNLGAYPALEAAKAEALLKQIRQLADKAADVGVQPVILCSPKIRLPLSRFLERFAPGMAVLSFNELTPDLEIEAIGMVKTVAD